MQLNKKQITNKVVSFLKSDSFQKDYNKHHPDNQISAASNQVNKWKLIDIEREIKELKGMLLEAAQDLTERRDGTPSGSMGREATSRLGSIKTPDGLLSHRITNIIKDPADSQFIISCRVELYFNPDWVRSPSLNPDNPGVDNLLRLLTNGWDYRYKKEKAPYGTWYSGASKYGKGTPVHNVFALPYREANGYLFSAIRRYNKKKVEKNILAFLDDSYSGFGETTLIRGIGGMTFGRR